MWDFILELVLVVAPLVPIMRAGSVVWQ